MSSIDRIETLLRQRQPDWWEVLCDAIPELNALEGTLQPPAYHAEGDVAVHTRLTVATCPETCDPDLLWAALLHDIGKPATTVETNGRITAHGHARLSAEMAEEILTRLGMPEGRRQRIVWAIHHHTFYHAWQLKDPSKATARQQRFIHHADFPFLLELVRIDGLASKGSARDPDTHAFYLGLWQQLTQSQQ